MWLKLNVNSNENRSLNKKYKRENKRKQKNKKLEEQLLKQLYKLNYTLGKNKIIDLTELAGNTKNFLIRNFTSGIVKGMGIGIGFSIITAIIIYVLQKLVKLNIPVISQYISDIINIVETTMNKWLTV